MQCNCYLNTGIDEHDNDNTINIIISMWNNDVVFPSIPEHQLGPVGILLTNALDINKQFSLQKHNIR